MKEACLAFTRNCAPDFRLGFVTHMLHTNKGIMWWWLKESRVPNIWIWNNFLRIQLEILCWRKRERGFSLENSGLRSVLQITDVMTLLGPNRLNHCHFYIILMVHARLNSVIKQLCWKLSFFVGPALTFLRLLREETPEPKIQWSKSKWISTHLQIKMSKFTSSKSVFTA